MPYSLHLLLNQLQNYHFCSVAFSWADSVHSCISALHILVLRRNFVKQLVCKVDCIPSLSLTLYNQLITFLLAWSLERVVNSLHVCLDFSFYNQILISILGLFRVSNLVTL